MRNNTITTIATVPMPGISKLDTSFDLINDYESISTYKRPYTTDATPLERLTKYCIIEWLRVNKNIKFPHEIESFIWAERPYYTNVANKIFKHLNDNENTINTSNHKGILWCSIYIINDVVHIVLRSSEYVY